MLEIASIRLLPLSSDGTLNSRLYNLPMQLKLTESQHSIMKLKWEEYKAIVKDEFSQASVVGLAARRTLNVSSKVL